jgi:hypothetical protein
MGDFLLGAAAMAFWVVGLYFMGFWRRTRDGLFLAFAAAFWLLALSRVAQALVGDVNETSAAPITLVRLSANLLILIGIVAKNQRG